MIHAGSVAVREPGPRATGAGAGADRTGSETLDPRPVLSVAVCTHSRAERLMRALRSLLRQTAPTGRFEILVVDNASTDDTAARVTTLRAGGAPLRYLHEPVLGLAHARNRALHAARAPYLAFLDDDEIAADDWVERLIEAIETLSPAPGCIGGRILPQWESDRPEWLDDSLLGFLSVLDLGSRTHRVDPARTPVYGGNICFARAPMIALGGFDPTLGRRGDELLSNEDTWAQRQLARVGLATWYVPLARVHHEMPHERLTQDWLLARAWWQGFSDSRMQRLEGRSALRLVIAIGRRLLRDAWRARSRSPHSPDPHASELARRCMRQQFVGALRECLATMRRPSRRAEASTGPGTR
jgi:GT2 family glycosyltransferase